MLTLTGGLEWPHSFLGRIAPLNPVEDSTTVIGSQGNYLDHDN